MKILLILIAMMLVSFMAGICLLPGRKQKSEISLHLMAMTVGYAYLIIAFYAFYILSQSMPIAVIASLAFPPVFYLIRVLVLRDVPVFRPITPSTPYIAGMCLLVVIFSSWPYVAHGWGNYWHGGNYDMEDTLNGRDSYLNYKVFEMENLALEKITGDSMWEDFAKKAKVLSPKAHEENSYWAWFGGNQFRFQYSNLAFWSYLLDEPYGLDILIIHAVLNLIQMALGVFALSRDVFKLNNFWSTASGLASVLSAFYLGTFWAGHVGSMMYDALAPGLFFLILSPKNKSDWMHTLPYAAILGGAAAFTYPQALLVGLGFLLGYKLYASEFIRQIVVNVWSKIGTKGFVQKVLISVLLVAALSLLLYLIWHSTEFYRLRQEGQYRAWGLVKNPAILPLFFGYLWASSPLANPWFYYGGMFAGIITAAAFLWALLSIQNWHAKFCRFFLGAWLLGAVMFYFCIRDSYYIYKYLYVHTFVLILLLCVFFANTDLRWARVVAILLLAFNLCSDVIAGWQIYSLPYNGRIAEFQELAKKDSKIISAAFVDLNDGLGTAVRETLKKFSNPSQIDPLLAQYFIVPRQTGGDITGAQLRESIFNTETLSVRRAPNRNYLVVRNWGDPEFFARDPLLFQTPFRWVGQGKNDNFGIYVIRADHSTDRRFPYLRMCGQKGPSAIGKLAVRVMDGTLAPISQFSLEGTNCIWLPAARVKDITRPLILRTGATGRSLRPPEDRILLYRMFGISWVDKIYDDAALAILNPPNDIISDFDKQNVQIGNGWWPPENWKGKHFRWASSGAEFLLRRPCAGAANVKLDYEIGPSQGTVPPEIAIKTAHGAVVHQQSISGERQTLEFKVPGNGVYAIVTNGEQKTLPRDYRVLDLKVFSLGASACEK